MFYSGDQAVCTGLNPRLSVRYGTIYLDNLRTGQFNSQSSEGKRFRQFVIQTLGQFRFTTEKYLEKKIVQIVSMNPYVALVNPNAAGDSAEDKFSDAVIIEAFKKMTVEAKKALKIVNKRGHKALSKGNEKSMLPFMEYDLVAQSLISEPSGIYKRALEVAQMENIQSGGLSSENVYESVSVQYMKESMSHALKELGYVMLPALICLAPALKSLKVVQAIRAGKLLNSFSISACLGAHSLAANTFFLVDSYRLYDEAYATIFGTEDGQNLTKALATLSQSDRSLMMSWIFLPLGTGALAGPVGNRLSAMAKKIGPRNMQTVQRLAAKLRSSRAAQ